MKNLFFITAFFIVSTSYGQTNGFVGSWEGKINPGVELRVVFHIKETGTGFFKSSADSPDQSAYGMKCDTTIVNGNRLTIEMNSLSASYTGELVNDSVINGIFIQGGITLSLQLKKTTNPTVLNRPQTPKPPFPYKSEDVVYYNSDKSLQYGATITIPEGKGPFPAAILITGSGAQDRDETLMGHKLFAVIADHLTRKGFIILRVDDRGVGKSTGKFTDATTADFAGDVNNGVEYLLTRPEADKTKIGLIGHSEGGMIAPMVAAQRKDIHFVVLLAGPGVPITELMAEQNYAIAKSNELSPDVLAEVKPLFTKVVTTIINSTDSLSAITNTTKVVSDWSINKSVAVLEEMNLATPDQQKEYVKNFVAQLRMPWFMYFISFDPTPYLEKLKGKVLAINGEKDIQVLSDQNLDGIERALKKAKPRQYDVVRLPGMNHLFQSCIKCTINEYVELEESFSPVALKLISDWMEKNLK